LKIVGARVLDDSELLRICTTGRLQPESTSSAASSYELPGMPALDGTRVVRHR
jgi:hypothetical protein